MINIIVVKNKDMQEIGILENAYDISVKRTVNELWQSSFCLPISDQKNELCSHMNYIDITSDTERYYGLYRIMPTETSLSDSNESITYTCEHVLATLLDDVMDGYFQYTNYTTDQVLQYLLSLQETKRWVLGQCDFTRYFSYSFENESGLLAPLLSIPAPFNEPYEFAFDTTVYPWVLNLIRPSDEVKAEIRWRKDMKSFNSVSDPSDIVNYIIPKGSGEGVNQLDIKSVNGGLKFLKDDESITKWGKHSYIWIDKRFEDAQTLKDNAQALLEQWKDPTISFTCDSVDLSILPEYSQEKKILNGVTRIIVDDATYEARIIGESISDLSKEYDVKYTINNKLDDIATTQTDVQRKQQVNDAYSQGATNILAFNYHDNCDNNIPAIIPFYIDDDVINVNTCELTFVTKKFRAYSSTVSAGGGTSATSSSGGGATATSSSGGGGTRTSSAGGGTTTSAGDGGAFQQSSGNLQEFAGLMKWTDVNEAFPIEGNPDAHAHSFTITIANMEHYHNVIIPSHTHEVTIQNHAHSVEIPDHSHDVSIQNHSHDVIIPDHTHSVLHGIYELDQLPSSVTIKVDGNSVPGTDLKRDRLDIASYLSKDSNGKITRGMHELTILPSGLARVEADVILRVFIQSRIGGVY